MFWWDKNNDKIAQNEELFFDLTGDSVPDMNYEEFEKYIESIKPKLEKSA
jgi:hypothetical protein